MENKDTTGVGRSSRFSAPKSRSKHSHGTPAWIANVIMLLLGIIIGAMGHWLLGPILGASSQGSGMDPIVAKTRHLKGNSNAPITLIEFSDFK